MGWKNRDPLARECGLFYCDKKRGGYCCYKCVLRKRCKNHCKNSPDKCGKYNEGGVKKNDRKREE